jgi:WD40 repeat protein
MPSHNPSSQDSTRKIFRRYHPFTRSPAQLGVSPPDEVKPASPEIWCLKVLNHSAEVFSASFSPDGKILASASIDGILRLWDVQIAVIIRQVRLQIDPLTWISTWRAAAFAFPGNEVIFAMALCAGTDDTLTYVGIYDALTGEKKISFSLRVKTTHLAYSPNCLRLVSVDIEHSVWLWDPANGTLLQKIEGDGSFIPRIHFYESIMDVALVPCESKPRYWISANKSNLASIATEGETIRVWDNMKARDIARLRGYSGEIRGLTLSPNIHLLVSASDNGEIRIWTLATGSCRIFRAHILPATWVGFSPDGQTLASASTDGTVKLWDVAFPVY